MMTKRRIKLLDTVTLVEDLPERKLKRGEVGTIVEALARDVYEVEFCDDEGQTYAQLALRGDQLIVLHNQGETLRIVAQNSPRGVQWQTLMLSTGLASEMSLEMPLFLTSRDDMKAK